MALLCQQKCYCRFCKADLQTAPAQWCIEIEKGILAKDIKSEVLNRAGLKAKDVPQKLSEYAKKDVYEFFAEAFAEYLDSPRPRKLARIFGEYINEILN